MANHQAEIDFTADSESDDDDNRRGTLKYEDHQRIELELRSKGKKKSIAKRVKDMFLWSKTPAAAGKGDNGEDNADGNLTKSTSEGQLKYEKKLGVFGTLRKTFRGKKKRRPSGTTDTTGSQSSLGVTANPGFMPTIDNFTDAFIAYEPKDNRPFGCGAVLLFPLFTNDLKGYKIDMREIVNFFRFDLGYELFQAPANLTKKELFAYIVKFREEIQMSGCRFDRLVFILLSHGVKDGLLTCHDRSGQDEEEEEYTEEVIDKHGNKRTVVKYRPVITKMEEILPHFKHDEEHLPKLKDCPKLFIVQACKGCTVVKAASRPPSAYDNIEAQNQTFGSSTNLPFQVNIPIDADMEICYATTEDKYSFVHPDHGSWLIQDMLEIFKKHMYTHHVADMLTVLRLSVSEKRMRFIDNNETVVAVQIPSITSTFRKQFWLHHGKMETSKSAQNLYHRSQQNLAAPRHAPTYPDSLNKQLLHPVAVSQDAKLRLSMSPKYPETKVESEDQSPAVTRRERNVDIKRGSYPDILVTKPAL